jgi:putative transcriptional regulator
VPRRGHDEASPAHLDEIERLFKAVTMKSLQGHLLIAAPGLDDPNFEGTVILVLEHTGKGAMGLVLNRPSGATVSDLAGKVFDEDFAWDKPIHLGGPVAGPFVAIHAIEDLADLEVIPGVYHTFEATKVQELISRKPEPSLAVVNYAGWGPGQLQGELDDGSWLTLPATPSHVFGCGTEDRWKVLVRETNARKLSEFLGVGNVPLDPRLN